MSEWKAKRFWKQSELRETATGWEIALDGRPVRTPGRLPLVVPTRSLAAAIAEEWDAQTEIIDPNSMPLTRAANSAIEKVAPQFADVANMLAEYGGTDLLCYRAEEPIGLVTLQAQEWDPLIDWAATELNARLQVTAGVMPVEQPEASLTNLRQDIVALDSFSLTALHDLVTLPGSLILGLAVIHGRLNAQEAHRFSRLGDEYQAKIWGQDEEAQITAESRLAAMVVAERFHKLAQKS